MKSITASILLFSQLALQMETALSIPIPSMKQNTLKNRGDNHMEEHWEKRAVGSQSKELTPAVVHATTSTATQAEKEAKQAVPITRGKYHQKALGIEAKQIGRAWLHGPIRAATEVPISGVIGAAHHTMSACRSVAQCKPRKFLYHVASIPGKLALGAVTPLYAVPISTVQTLVPTGRAVGHSFGVVKHGIRNTYRKKKGLSIDKNTVRQRLLEEARERDPGMKEHIVDSGKMLRADNWYAPSHPEKAEKEKDRSGGGSWNGSGGAGGCLGQCAFNA